MTRVHVKTDRAFGVVLGMLFVLVYTQGYMERAGLPRGMVKMIVELPVFAILLHLINRGLRQLPPGFFLIGLYVVWTVVSGLYHGDGLPSAVLYSRYVVYPYIIFAAVWCTPLSATAVRRIGMTIAGVFLLQIAASAFEVVVLGQRIEAHVGALFADGGGLATEFPLFAMALTVPFYLYCSGNPLILVLSWVFFLVGYASGKRAIYFLGPALYLFIFLWYTLRVPSRPALKRSLAGVCVFVCLGPVLLWGMSRSHGISDDHSRGVVERVTYAINAAIDYTTTEKDMGQTRGRTATSRRVLSAVLTDPWHLTVFGRGPATMREEGQRHHDLMIGYGICGWTRDALCVGWPGLVLYVLFQFYLFGRLRSIPQPYDNPRWMAIRFGTEVCFTVFLGVYFSYSISFTTNGHLSYVYFCLLGLLMSPQHRHILQEAS